MIEKIKAKQIKVVLEGTTEEYAMKFLAIYNNVKSNDELLALENDYENGVYVTVEPDEVEKAKEWLESFGEIKWVVDVLCLKLYNIDWNYEKYDSLVVCPFVDD